MKSPFSSRANAQSERRRRLSWWNFAMVSRSFFRAECLSLNELEVELYEVLNIIGIFFRMVLIRVEWDIFVRICETTTLQYDRWIIRFWGSSDHSLSCKFWDSLFSEYNIPLVSVISMLFISIISYSVKLFSFILLCIVFDFLTRFLVVM